MLIYPSTCLSSNFFELVFVFLTYWRFTLFTGCAQLSCVLALYGAYRFLAERMKSAQGVEGVYWAISWAVFPVDEIGIPYATYPFSSSSLQSFRRQSFLAVNAQIGRFIVEQVVQCLKAPILPSVLVPTPVFKVTTDLVPKTRILGRRVRRGRFISSRPR